MVNEFESAWVPRQMPRHSTHQHQAPRNNDRDATDDDEGCMFDCIASLIENPQREVGLSLYDPSTNTMRLMQYIETGKN